MIGKPVEPAAGLVELITNIVDQVLQKRRVRPTPAQKGMSKKQFAASVGLGLSTIDSEIREGRLEAVKVRKRTIITTEAGKRWLESRPRIAPQRVRDNGAAHASV